MWSCTSTPHTSSLIEHKDNFTFTKHCSQNSPKAHNPYRATKSRWVEISQILRILAVRYRNRIRLSVPTPSHINRFHILMYYFINIHFYISLPCMPPTPIWYLVSGLSNRKRIHDIFEESRGKHVRKYGRMLELASSMWWGTNYTGLINSRPYLGLQAIGCHPDIDTVT
jgi:hypothetical protein